MTARRTIARLGWVASAALGAVLLAGCSGGGKPQAGATSTATSSATATAPATPTSTATSSATATERPTPTDSASSAPVSGAALCTVADLSGAIGERNGAPAGTGSGMNQYHDAIILTNIGKTSCTLQGWPGVSLVGDGNGTQLGAAATLNRDTPHPTLTVAPGDKVQAPIDYTNAAVYPPSECGQKQADGLRVYPPGSKASLFIRAAWQACTSTQHDLMKVGAFVAYP